MRLTWSAHPEPWAIAQAVVDDLAPPLNLASAGGQHRLTEALTVARTALATPLRPSLDYRPPGATFIVGYDVAGSPVTRRVATRRTPTTQAWLRAISAAAQAAAGAVAWSSSWRYAAVIEVRLPNDGDVDNYVKDILDRSHACGMFAGDDKHVDLVHASKRSGVAASEAGARVEVWRR